MSNSGRLWALALFILVWALGLSSIGRGMQQWDFHTYYHAARAHADGINPYDTEALERHAGTRIQLPFVYPPPALAFFRLFSFADYPDAVRIYFFAKLLTLAGMALLLSLVILEERNPELFFLFSALAFNGAVFLDLRSGNPSLFEQAILWGAFAFYLRGRPGLFCLGVFVAASVKLQPLVFLGLLAFHPSRYRWRWLAGTVSAFAAFQAASWFLAPDLTRSFWEGLWGANSGIVFHERGIINPSSYAFLEDVWEVIRLNGGPAAAPSLRTAVYAAAAAAVAAVTIRTLARPGRPRTAADLRESVFLFCCAYALVAPRFKDYTYVLLLAPAFHLVREARPSSFALLFVLFSLSTGLPWITEHRIFFGFLWSYYPLALAAFSWALYLRRCAV